MEEMETENRKQGNHTVSKENRIERGKDGTSENILPAAAAPFLDRAPVVLTAGSRHPLVSAMGISHCWPPYCLPHSHASLPSSSSSEGEGEYRERRKETPWFSCRIFLFSDLQSAV